MSWGSKVVGGHGACGSNGINGLGRWEVGNGGPNGKEGATAYRQRIDIERETNKEVHVAR